MEKYTKTVNTFINFSKHSKHGDNMASVDDFINKHSSEHHRGIKVVLPYGYLVSKEDEPLIKAARKRLKESGFEWDSRGYYYKEG